MGQLPDFYLPSVSPVATPPKPRRVVVVDDDLDSHALVGKDPTIEILLTSEPWEALDALDSGEVELVLCSASLRTGGGAPLYRLLWNSKPEIKTRFAFIVAQPMAGSTGRVLVRPVRIGDVARLLDDTRPPS